MKYGRKERLEIGRRIYEGEITTAMAAEEYGINLYTARDYLRAYKASINITIPKQEAIKNNIDSLKSTDALNVYRSMSKEQLINELIKAQMDTIRAKKGYEVKGDGPNKTFSPVSTKNLK